MRRRAALLLAALSWTAARAADDVSVTAEREGTPVRVVARATVDAPLGLVWRTLTDYNALARFVPGIHSSRLLEYQGNAAIVEQKGEARLLFFSFPIDVTVASVEYPPLRVDVRVLKGNLRRLDGGYRIEPLADGRLTLRWSGLIEPEAPLPPLLGELVLRAQVEDQFLGMVREIERRETIRKEGSRGE